VTGSVTRIRRRHRRLPRLRRLRRNSGELFRRRRSSLAEGEHTIAFVSSIPFRFVVPVYVWRLSPSNLHPSSSLRIYLQSQPPWPPRYELLLTRLQHPAVRQRRHRQEIRDAEPHPGNPYPLPETHRRSSTREDPSADRRLPL
jgi:hypothetical protein